MNPPKMKEFDGWRNSVTGIWFFEYVLPDYARLTAEENGRSVGNRGDTMQEDYMILAKQAGIVEGVEYAATLDPFENEREEIVDESTSDRKADID